MLVLVPYRMIKDMNVSECHILINPDIHHTRLRNALGASSRTAEVSLLVLWAQNPELLVPHSVPRAAVAAPPYNHSFSHQQP